MFDDTDVGMDLCAHVQDAGSVCAQKQPVQAVLAQVYMTDDFHC